MEHNQILPECSVMFTQINKNLAIIERKLDKAVEKMGEVATNMAVTTVTVQNHQASLEKSIEKQEERFQIMISRIWKVIYVLIAGAGVGGGSAAVANLVF